MFIVKNALKNVARNKGRNVLMIIIVAIITAAATIGLAIVQSASHARATALDNTTITAQISVDRSAIINQSRSQNNSDSTDMKSMNNAMSVKQLTLEDYEQYDKSDYGVASSYYIETASAASAEDSIEPVDSNGTITSESNDSSDSGETEQNSNQSDTTAPSNSMPVPMGDLGGGKGGNFAMTTGDFALVGFSSDEAIAHAPNGTFTMVEGQVFGYDESSDNEVIISQTLASANNIAVGDTITLVDATDSSTTYTLTVVGIYSNTSEAQTPMGGPMASTASDPANAIYTSVSTLNKLGLTSDKTIEVTDARGNTRETSAAQLSYTYVFANKADYERFVESVRTHGLSDEYTVSSADIEQYEASLVPLNNLARFARTLLIVVLAVGAVVLVVLTIFNIRERKYEIGVLTAIGIAKIKVAAQFTFELLVITLIGLAVGTGIGAASSVPVSNALLSSQVEAQQAQQEQQRAQFGRDMQAGPRTMQEDSSSDLDSAKSTAQLPNDNENRGSWNKAGSMISQVNATVNWATLGWMLLIGIGLTLLAALVAVVFVMRYEPLQILADRS